MEQDGRMSHNSSSSSSSNEDTRNHNETTNISERTTPHRGRSVNFSTDEPEQFGVSSDPSQAETDELDDGMTGELTSVNIVTKGGRRTSLKPDMETGRLSHARSQRVLLRSENSFAARSAGERRRLFCHSHKEEASQVDESDHEPSVEMVESKRGRYMIQSKVPLTKSSRRLTDQRQYCLRAVPPKRKTPKYLRWLPFGLGDTRFQIYEDNLVYSKPANSFLHPNMIVIRFLHWAFRQTFPVVLLTAAVGFFSLTILFALLIWLDGLRHPECIGGVEYEDDYFTDAFILSWTTFSTVGYGLIYHGISTDDAVFDIRRCTAVTVLCSLEAFVGVIFASICGAVIFIKVSRVQSFAQVAFSEIICIRYGSGVRTESDDEGDVTGSADGSDDSEDGFDMQKCPVLEFRIANRMFGIPGGELIDTSVTVNASIDASQACPTVKQATLRRRTKKGKRRGRRFENVRRRSIKNNQFDEGSSDDQNAVLPSIRMRSASAFEEDPTGRLSPKRIIAKLECETHDHPFFRRVFTIRHTLDHNSPLLTPAARSMVRHNHGYWPSALDDPEAVRNSIQFDQLLVSLSGTSNADANSVYFQKVYDFSDLHVGYRFVNMLYRNGADGPLRVDLSLINDVMEQNGGGGEPFDQKPEPKMVEMDVL